MKTLPDKYIDRLAGLCLLSISEMAKELGVVHQTLYQARKHPSKAPPLMARALLQLGIEKGFWDGEAFILPATSRKRIERLRRFLGLAQAAAASRFDTKQYFIFRMEKGLAEVDQAYLAKLEKAASDEGLILLPGKPKK